jgi:predicted component of type VI protein secretion system
MAMLADKRGGDIGREAENCDWYTDGDPERYVFNRRLVISWRTGVSLSWI